MENSEHDWKPGNSVIKECRKCFLIQDKTGFPIKYIIFDRPMSSPVICDRDLQIATPIKNMEDLIGK